MIPPLSPRFTGLLTMKIQLKLFSYRCLREFLMKHPGRIGGIGASQECGAGGADHAAEDPGIPFRKMDPGYCDKRTYDNFTKRIFGSSWHDAGLERGMASGVSQTRFVLMRNNDLGSICETNSGADVRGMGQVMFRRMFWCRTPFRKVSISDCSTMVYARFAKRGSG